MDTRIKATPLSRANDLMPRIRDALKGFTLHVTRDPGFSERCKESRLLIEAIDEWLLNQ